MTVLAVFKQCVKAIRNGTLIKRVSITDKEYHFQNWFKARLAETGLNFEIGGRNSYPDFRMVATTDGYELKGLAYPGRDASFDSNSQVPSGFHNGRTVDFGSVFRGILLGTVLPDGRDLTKEFYQAHRFSGVTVFDPFMGSGTTIGEAHKLGFTAIGRDINPVAVGSVRTALGPVDEDSLQRAFRALSQGVGTKIRALYRSKDTKGRPCDVLYFFWVMQVRCLLCHWFSRAALPRSICPQHPKTRPHTASVRQGSGRNRRAVRFRCLPSLWRTATIRGKP